jgi:hypothetical protein
MITTKGIRLASGLVVSEEPKKDATTSRARSDSNASALQLDTDDPNRGANKSGRPWKTVKKEKASMTIYKPLKKTIGSTWEKRQAEKLKIQEAKELQQEILEKKREKIELEKKKSEERRKRKAENELKSAKVQVMSHPEKMKKMSKKQLRSVYKTRMGDDGVVRLVGAYE